MGFLSELRPIGSSDWLDYPRHLETLLNQMMGNREPRSTRPIPRVDIVENPEGFVIKCEVPGMGPEDVQITFAGDTLTVKGEKRQDERCEGEHWHMRERSWGIFERSFSFPTSIVADGVQAETKNGLLLIKVPKTKEAKARQITIKAK